MRIRTIKPEFFKHDELAELAPLIRLLFVGLWCVADCAGRLEDRPARIKAEVLPYDKCDVVAALDLLAKNGFITRYQVGALNLIQINNFRKHQRITGKEAETPSRFPAQFTNDATEQVLRDDELPEQSQGNNWETPETTGKEGKGKEGKGDMGAGRKPAHKASKSASLSKPSGVDEAVSYFVANGSTDEQGRTFFDHFEANGWRQGGKTAMKDWQAAARNWIRRSGTVARGAAAGLARGNTLGKNNFGAAGGAARTEEFVKLPIVGVDVGADEVAALEAGKGGAS